MANVIQIRVILGVLTGVCLSSSWGLVKDRSGRSGTSGDSDSSGLFWPKAWHSRPRE
jgi:hypothetical protein